MILACSGGSNVGQLSNQAAIELTQEGFGKMFCLAGVGGRVPGIMKTTEAAEGILAIDGCPLDCVKNCLEQAGFTKYDHLRVTDLGFEKGKSAPSSESIATVGEAGAGKLGCC